jgi:hypothetical protein
MAWRWLFWSKNVNMFIPQDWYCVLLIKLYLSIFPVLWQLSPSSGTQTPILLFNHWSANNKVLETVITHFFTISNTRYRHLLLASIHGTDPCMCGICLLSHAQFHSYQSESGLSLYSLRNGHSEHNSIHVLPLKQYDLFKGYFSYKSSPPTTAKKHTLSDSFLFFSNWKKERKLQAEHCIFVT